MTNAGAAVSGRSLDGLSYTILGLVGRGPTADVYRAEHPMHDRPVALKVSRHLLTAQDAAVLHRDRALLKHLAGHPHVVGLLDASRTTSGRPWIVTELHDFSLAAARPGGPGWSEESAREWSLDVLHGLGAIHAAGGTHRHLRPSNVLVRHGVAALCDIGGGIPVSHLDTTAGTPGFVAPEVLRGGPPTARSDVYAAALTLSWLLGPDSPHAVHQLVTRASSPEPGDRPAHGTAFLEALESAWGVEPRHPRTATGTRPTAQRTVDTADSPATVPIQLRPASRRRDDPQEYDEPRNRLSERLLRVAPLLAVLLTAGALTAVLQVLDRGVGGPSQSLPEITLGSPGPTRVEAGPPPGPPSASPAGTTGPAGSPSTPPSPPPARTSGPAAVATPPTAPAARTGAVPTSRPTRPSPLPARPTPAPSASTAAPPGAPAELAHLPASAEDDVRPRWDTPRTTVAVTNLSAGTVRVFWPDAAGRRVLISTVAPGQTRTVNTWETHTFVAVDAQDSTLFVVVATARPGRMTIAG